MMAMTIWIVLGAVIAGLLVAFWFDYKFREFERVMRAMDIDRGE